MFFVATSRGHTLFAQFPEAPIDDNLAAPGLTALNKFADTVVRRWCRAENFDVGRVTAGFHTSATLDAVVAAFEIDGFTAIHGADLTSVTET